MVHTWVNVRWGNLCRQKTQNPVVNGGSVSDGYSYSPLNEKHFSATKSFPTTWRRATEVLKAAFDSSTFSLASQDFREAGTSRCACAWAFFGRDALWEEAKYHLEVWQRRPRELFLRAPDCVLILRNGVPLPRHWKSWLGGITSGPTIPGMMVI